MFHAGYLILEIILLDKIIISGRLQATQPDSHRQNPGSVESYEDEHDDSDDFDDFEVSPEYSLKEESREFHGFRDVVMDDHGYPDSNDEAIQQATLPGNTTPLSDFFEEVKKQSSHNGIDSNALETEFMIIYRLRPLDIGHERSRKFIASHEIIQRISAIQEMLVKVRLRMLVNLFDRANQITTDIEYDFPEKHICSVQLYNKLILQDWPAKYPYGFLNMVRTAKEALLKSKVESTPISVVDEDVYRRLEYLMNRLGERLWDHGKLVFAIFEGLVIEQKRIVRKFCEIPRRPKKIKIKS